SRPVADGGCWATFKPPASTSASAGSPRPALRGLLLAPSERSIPQCVFRFASVTRDAVTQPHDGTRHAALLPVSLVAFQCSARCQDEAVRCCMRIRLRLSDKRHRFVHF